MRRHRCWRARDIRRSRAVASATRWFVDECAIETRIAELMDDRLISLKIIPHVPPGLARAQVGDIYLVRVTKSARGMRGAFVDLGESGDGFLRSRDSLPEGRFVMARVTQSAYGSKVAVLKPEVGADLPAENPRQARRVSAPQSAEQYLAARIQDGEALTVDSDKPWRGPPDAENSAPGLFEREGIEAQIEAALDPITHLPGGGRLVIEQTEAVTAVDVDAGSSARISDANAGAADEIPYQIAARSLAGNIVIVDLKKTG